MRRPRITAALVTVCAGLATLLAAIGFHRVLAYSVAPRVRETGVRLALGAEPGRVMSMALGQEAGLVRTGLLMGLSVALIAGRLVTALLFNVELSDPLALLGAASTLIGIAILSTTVPAWRASHVPPSEARRPY